MIYYRDEEIIIRQIEKRDVNALFSWWIDGALNTYDPRPLPATPEALRKECDIYCNMISLQVMNPDHEKNIYKYFIIDSSEGETIGFINLFDFSKETMSCELGICIGDKRYHRKGIALKALNAVSDYCFESGGLKRIYIETSPENSPAIKLFEKAGFEKRGEVLDDGKIFLLMDLVID